MKFGVREICDVVLRAKSNQWVGNKYFYKNEPVIYFDTLKTSSMEGAATTVYAQGGRGNSRLVAWEGERTVTFTMEDALISPEGFQILTGAGLFEASTQTPIYIHTSEIVKYAKNQEENNVVIVLSSVPSVDERSEIYIFPLKNGEPFTEPYCKGISVANKTVTISAINDLNKFDNSGVCLVDYYIKQISKAVQIDITPDKFGGYYYLEASTLFRNQDGVDLPAEFIIPKCKIQSNFTFTMASSGDPSTFTFTIDAFPDYTKFDKTKKVFASIQIIQDNNGTNELKRVSTAHDSLKEYFVNIEDTIFYKYWDIESTSPDKELYFPYNRGILRTSPNDNKQDFYYGTKGTLLYKYRDYKGEVIKQMIQFGNTTSDKTYIKRIEIDNKVIITAPSDSPENSSHWVMYYNNNQLFEGTYNKVGEKSLSWIDNQLNNQPEKLGTGYHTLKIIYKFEDNEYIGEIKIYVKQYTLTLDANGGTILGEPSISCGIDLNENYCDVLNWDKNNIPTPIREGYRFAGWYYRPSNLIIQLDKATYSINDDGTLVALWEDNNIYYGENYHTNIYNSPYVLTFDPGNNSSIFGNYRQAKYKIHYEENYSDAIPELPIPSKEGNEFIGWIYYNPNGEDFILNEDNINTSYYGLQSNGTFYAIWNEMPSNNEQES